MLHEPVTLDGYGALMIPAKVSKLGPALHWHYMLNILANGAAWSSKPSPCLPAQWRTAALMLMTHAAIVTATQQEQHTIPAWTTWPAHLGR